MNSTKKVKYVIKFLAQPKDFDVRSISYLLCVPIPKFRLVLV